MQQKEKHTKESMTLKYSSFSQAGKVDRYNSDDRAHKTGVNQQVALCAPPPTLNAAELLQRARSLSSATCTCLLAATEGGADDVHECGLHAVAQLDVRVGASDLLGCALH